MSGSNPWKTVSSRVIYKNPWITLREDQVVNPAGNPGIYSVVETRVATGVVALDADGCIVLVGQYRYPTEVYSWEIPEGGGEAGETPLATIQRELEEEAGVRALSWEPLGEEFHTSNCISNEQAFLFLARDLVPGKQNPDETEKIAVKRVPFSEALAMVDRGEIKDAMSIVAILRAARLSA
jgi:8-oxo-dGTP pyrophosphatase MutT (NUDIX family)